MAGFMRDPVDTAPPGPTTVTLDAIGPIGGVVGLFLFCGTCLSCSSLRGPTPVLHDDYRVVEAAYKGDVPSLRRLLSMRSDPDTRWGEKAFEFFAHRPQHVASPRWTGLHAAAYTRRSDAAELLLASGADVNADDGYGGTPLYYLVDGADGTCRVVPLLKLLLGHGAAVNLRAGPYLDEANRWTPLHRAVVRGCPDVVKMLVNAGADVSAVDGKGETALALATRINADPQIIGILASPPTNRGGQ
jgi:hypothetical protein